MKKNNSNNNNNNTNNSNDYDDNDYKINDNLEFCQSIITITPFKCHRHTHTHTYIHTYICTYSLINRQQETNNEINAGFWFTATTAIQTKNLNRAKYKREIT